MFSALPRSLCSLIALTEQGDFLRAVAHPPKSIGEPSDAYLGLLYPTEDFKIYGQVTRHILCNRHPRMGLSLA